MTNLSKAARKELTRIERYGAHGIRGCDANLKSAPALVRRGLLRVDMVGKMPFYVITAQGLAALDIRVAK
jgi:hypothetical protein